jgi:serine phosphatase RsbU (regulator of sigma subunit)
MYFYTVELLDLRKQRKWVYIFYALMIAFTPVTRTNYFLAGVVKWPWGYYPIRATFLYDIFILSFCFYWTLGLKNIVLAYRKESSLARKTQLKFVALALFVVTLAFVDFVAKYKLQVYPWGYLPVVVFLSILFYAIARYKLFEIDTVIHRTILWFITLVILVMPVGISVILGRGWIRDLPNTGLLALTSLVLVFFIWYYTKLKPKVDHLFRRRKYDYYRVLSEIGQKIGSELDINNVLASLFKELREILYVRNGFVLVQQSAGRDYTQALSVDYKQPSGENERPAITLCNDSGLNRWFASTRRVLEREQVEVDPQYADIKKEALEFFSRGNIELLIPVIMGERINGFVGLGKKDNLQRYTIRDVELLGYMGQQIGVTIDNALHHEDIVEKERLAEEMKLGREIQIALLPQETPLISGLTVQGLMQPAKEIGGDYYDFITLPDKDKLSIVIGDVSGKGVAAGLLMAMAKTAIHTLSQEQTSPKEILLRTNTILNKHIGGHKFMTLLYLTWQAKTNTLIYSSGGHEHILLYRNLSKEVETIQSGGFMLGMMADIDSFLEEKQIKLDHGDKILLYTDGVTEAQNQAEERFGLSRLQDTFQNNSLRSASDLMRAIKDDVYSFIGSHPQYDDITLVVLEAA